MTALQSIPDQTLSVREVMERTGLGNSTIRQYIATGRLRAWRVGRQLRVDAADVARLFQPVNPQSA